MTKIKREIKKLLSIKTQIKLAVYFIGLTVIACSLLLATVNLYRFIKDPVGQEKLIASSSLSIPKAKAEEVELTMREYIQLEVHRAGLDWKTVECIIQNESGWNNWNNNWNTNGTIDSGIFMINSVHKNTISLEDRYDYKKATKWAIEKRLHDGNWSAWVAYNTKCK